MCDGQRDEIAAEDVECCLLMKTDLEEKKGALKRKAVVRESSLRQVRRTLGEGRRLL